MTEATWSGSDVFLRDRGTRTTELVSVAFDGGPADGDSYAAAISDDSRWVVFTSYATNLVEDGVSDDPFTPDVFLRDMSNDETRRLSTNSFGSFEDQPTISGDGSTVMFMNGNFLFVHDVASNTTTDVRDIADSLLQTVREKTPSLSTDGRLAAIVTHEKLMDEDDGGHTDAYLIDLVSNEPLALLSRTADGIQPLNTEAVRLSGDGRFALLQTDGGPIPGSSDAQVRFHAYLKDIESGELALVNETVAGGAPIRGETRIGYDAISADGSRVAVLSEAADLVGGDTNRVSDVFVTRYDDPSPPPPPDTTFERVSLRDDDGQSAGAAFWPAVSSDGSRVLYVSQSDQPVDGDPSPGVGAAGTHWYVRDLVDGTTERISVSSDEVPATDLSLGDGMDIDGDGSVVVFVANSTQLAPPELGDGPTRGSDVYLRDLAAGTTRRISDAPGGVGADGSARWVQISDNGRWVVFQSDASNLTSDADDGGSSDVFLHDTATGTTTLLSVDGANAEFPFISADGSTVAYMLDGTVVAHDRTTGETAPLVDGAPQMAVPSVSRDGRFVTVVSPDALTADDDDPGTDGYLVDRRTEEITLLSRNEAGNQTETSRVELSDDGRFALIQGDGGLVPDSDAPPGAAIYLRDLATGELSMVNRNATGHVSTRGESMVGARSLSADASRVVFESTADDLVAGDTNGSYDIFARSYERPVVPGYVEVVLDGSGVSVGSGTDVTPETPVTAMVTPPAGLEGTLRAVLEPGDGTAPAGYALFQSTAVPTAVGIDGPPATPANPYVLRLSVDVSLLGTVLPADVQVFKDGVPVADCTGSGATPDPCVAERVASGDGDAALTVRTSGFSTWAVGRLRYGDAKITAPLKPYDQVNRLKAGSVVPVLFTLPGARGFDVLADGYPQLTTCAGAAVPAGKSVLTPVPFTKHYLLLWATPPRTKGCHDLVLRFRDGQDERVRFDLR